MYGAETWTFGNRSQLPYCFEMWCYRRMEKINWTKCVENEVSHTVKEERNILHTIKCWKANRIGHILHRNCLLQHVTEERWKEK